MGKSEYDGYVGVKKDGSVAGRPATTADRARGARSAFDADYEGKRTAYETYKKPGDPASAEMSRRLGAASEDAIDRVHRTNRDSDNERVRERRRGGSIGDSPGQADRAPYNWDKSGGKK